MPSAAAVKAQVNESFVRLSPILEIVETCIYTGKLADEKPVSLILVAEQESAKTEALKHFYGTPSLRFVSDLTSKGLDPYRADIESGQLRHIVIMDLIRVVSHNKGVAIRTIQTLAGIMEEGAADVSDAGGLVSWKNFPRIGCMTALTPAYYRARAGNWRKSGFLSRFLPVCFSYSEDTQHLIHMAIADGHQLPERKVLRLPKQPAKVEIPKDMATAICRRSEELAAQQNLYGFRYHRSLRALAKARALACGRSVVNGADMQKLSDWSVFFSNKMIRL